jgi:predicted transcriptional regulator
MNGKEKNSERAMEQAGFESSQTAVSYYAHVKGRGQSRPKDRRCQKEGVENGAQKVEGLSETHRQGIATLGI